MKDIALKSLEASFAWMAGVGGSVALTGGLSVSVHTIAGLGVSLLTADLQGRMDGPI